MAMNLRKNMPASHTLIILDVNGNATNRFVEEAKGMANVNGAAPNLMKVQIANRAREAAERSVRLSPPCIKRRFVFPWSAV